MNEPELVPKRNLPIAAAIFMLCLGGAGLVVSKVVSRVKKKLKPPETPES